MLATLRLRDEQLSKLRTLAGLKTDAALARKMRMDPATLYRVLTQGKTPSRDFIANLVACFPGFGLDDLFEVIDTEVPAA